MYWLLVAFVCLRLWQAHADVLVEGTAPINPVETGGIFAFHCQVWNLGTGEEVTLLRHLTTGEAPQRISVDQTLIADMDERVFLAVRQLDGSSVYFLTIMDVTREDEGEYVCKINSLADSSGGLPSASVTVQTKYFPSDSNPNCIDVDVSAVQIGEELTLTCSSEIGNPVVELSWSRTGLDTILDGVLSKRNGEVYSTLTFKVSNDDAEAIFICTVQSIAFPDVSQTCHIGPLLLDASAINPGANEVDVQSADSSSVTVPWLENIEKDTFFPEDCQTVCLATSTSTAYWTIATIVAGVMALILCVWVVVLFAKYRQLPRTSNSGYIAGRQLPERIYSEVEMNRPHDSMYISLEKQKKGVYQGLVKEPDPRQKPDV